MEIRKLRNDESDRAARVHRVAFDERLPWLSGRYAPGEDAAYFAVHVFRDCQVWGAFRRAELVGLIAFRTSWIDQFYVLPSHQGAGVGTALLDLCKAEQRQLNLWTFQRNERARRFYERRGFVAIEHTNGSRNDEGEPDVLYQWRAKGR